MDQWQGCSTKSTAAFNFNFNIVDVINTRFYIIAGAVLQLTFAAGCKKNKVEPTPVPPTPPAVLKLNSFEINGQTVARPDKVQYNVPVNSTIKLSFNKAVNYSTLASNLRLQAYSAAVPVNISFAGTDSSQVLLTPASTLQHIYPYSLAVLSGTKESLGTSTKTINVEIPSSLTIPNVFTPNGDGINDIFFLKTSNLNEISIIIYDRWGTKVYELISNKGNIAWDGKNQVDTEVPQGTYFYKLKAEGMDGQIFEKKGTITLIR